MKVNSTNVASAGQRIVITRADGTVEDYGVVGYWHRSFVRRLWWRLSRLVWHIRYPRGFRNG